MIVLRGILIGVVLTLLLGATIIPGVTNGNLKQMNFNENYCVFQQIKYHKNSDENETNEFVDQSNTADNMDATYASPLLRGWHYSQSFQPTQTSLTKISLAIGKYGTPPSNTKITVSIRENSTDGDIIASTILDADTMGIGWIEVNFTETSIRPDETYYIIVQADQFNYPNNGYYWYFTIADNYKKGTAFVSSDSKTWITVYHGKADYFFKTYWKDYGPSNPIINGKKNGKAQERYEYTFYSTDPEGHDVEYYIKWGDGHAFKWTGPYESGEIVTKSHQWASESEYNITVKCRDEYHVESDWSTMKVTMPNKNIINNNNPLLPFLKRHPLLFQILKFLDFFEKIITSSP